MVSNKAEDRFSLGVAKSKVARKSNVIIYCHVVVEGKYLNTELLYIVSLH